MPKKSTDKKAATGGSVGDGLANGAEFAGTILVFTLIGYVLDRIFDTKPWCILGLTLFGIVGQFVRTWYTYDATMKQHEADRLAKIDSSPRRVSSEVQADSPPSTASGAASVRSNKGAA